MQLDIILEGDSTQILKTIPDKSIDLIICDPPYNIKKAEWDRISNYQEWLCSNIILELQRVLKDNGSFYLFHNDMPTISKVMVWIENKTKFVFKQMIVWNKKFKGAKNEGYLQGYNEVEGLRNYQKMAEYILFYTFQDDTGLTKVKLDMNNFPSLRKYFRDFQQALGLSLPQINKRLGHRKAEHAFYWNSSQWDLPTKETYEELCKLPLLRQDYSFVRQDYEKLRQEYESLRQQYEEQRYVFNNQKTHHSVWNYELISNKQNGHITEKPLPLIENIIRYSSNQNQIILDPFIGSGTTAIAAMNLQRHFIGIEKDSKYVKIANERINKNRQQTKLLYS